ncbi:MAG: hypothetical protein Tsb008_18780 [Rhodothalassiaceae bacterium]
MPEPTVAGVSGRQGAGGFTLIEVLVAFAIAAIMLLPLMSGMSRGMRGIAASEARLALLAHAENAMARVGVEWPLVPGTLRGEEGGIVHEVVIMPAESGLSPETAADIGMDLLHVRVLVRDREGNELDLESLRLLSLSP